MEDNIRTLRDAMSPAFLILHLEKVSAFEKAFFLELALKSTVELALKSPFSLEESWVYYLSKGFFRRVNDVLRHTSFSFNGVGSIRSALSSARFAAACFTPLSLYPERFVPITSDAFCA